MNVHADESTFSISSLAVYPLKMAGTGYHAIRNMCGDFTEPPNLVKFLLHIVTSLFAYSTVPANSDKNCSALSASN